MSMTLQQMAEKLTNIERNTKEIFFRLEALETKKINKSKKLVKKEEEKEEVKEVEKKDNFMS